jgi:hypothetical protein
MSDLPFRLRHVFNLALATDAAFPRCAMAKKRKAEEPTSTLHDFFGASSGAKRKKSTSGTQMPVQKPAKARPAEEEIIEITDSEEEEPLKTAMEGRPESPPSKGFGTLLDCLLHGGPQPQDTSGYLEETQESKSVPITRESSAPLEPLALQHADSSFSEGDSEGYESYNHSVASDGDGEWGMGDDERTTMMDLDEVDEPEEELDDEGKVLLPPESQEDGDQEGSSCPLCGRDLSEFDEQVRSQNFSSSVWELDLKDIREGYVTSREQVYRYYVPADLEFQTSMCPYEIPQRGLPTAIILSRT